MTLYKFRTLSEDDQALTVWHGKYFLSRMEHGHTVMLYIVHGFYVEVYYDRATNAVEKFNPFCSLARLELYFNHQFN